MHRLTQLENNELLITLNEDRNLTKYGHKRETHDTHDTWLTDSTFYFLENVDLDLESFIWFFKYILNT